MMLAKYALVRFSLEAGDQNRLNGAVTHRARPDDAVL